MSSDKKRKLREKEMVSQQQPTPRRQQEASPFPSSSSSSSSPQGPPPGDRRILSGAMPLDVLGDIAGYLDLVSRIRLAACSTFLQNIVFVESKSLWVNLDFGKLLLRRWQLSDDALRSLLERVDARNVTKKLSLFGCGMVWGQGLEPLRGSCALQSLNLVAQDISSSVVVNILSSMPPVSTYRASRMSSSELQSTRQGDAAASSLGLKAVQDDATSLLGLKVVRFSEKHHPFYIRWGRAFAQALQSVRPSDCGHCHRAIEQQGRSAADVDGCTIHADGFCECCETFTCGRGDCPKAILCEAEECTNMHCSSCREIKWCGCHARDQENKCNCDMAFCCECSGEHLTACFGCEAPLCKRCCIEECNTCSTPFCGECYSAGEGFMMCETGCGTDVCKACRPKLLCNGCEIVYCKKCIVRRRCLTCEKKICPCTDPCLDAKQMSSCRCEGGKMCSFCINVGAKCSECRKHG